MADNNIVIKITSETQLTDAQLQLRELTDLSKDYEQQMKDLKKAEEEDLKAMRERIAAGKEDASIINEVLETYKKKRQEVQKSISANKSSIDALNKEVKAYKQVEAGGKRLTMQLREMREQLMRMEEAGEEGSRAYQDLAVAAARLQDQIGDTSQRIRYLASDTRDLDAAMSVGSGLGGVFNVATSSAALFGGEMEELEKAFYKVQNVMSIINGLQEVAIVLNKDSAASVVINNALERIRAKLKARTAVAETAATGAAVAETAAVTAQTGATAIATTVQMAFNASMLANPVTWVVAGIAALVAGIVALVSWYKKSNVEARGFAAAVDEVNKKVKESEEATSYAARIAEAEGKAWREINKIETDGLRKEMNTAGRAYNEMVKKKRAANGKITEEEQQHMDDMKALYDEKNKALLEKQQDFHIREIEEEREQKERIKEAAQRRRDEIKEAEEELRDMQIALMEEGKEKEIAQLNLDYSRKIAAVKGNSKAEIALRSALEEELQQKLGEVALRYETERWEKLEEIRKQAAEDLKRVQEEELQEELDYQEEIQAARDKYGVITSQERLAMELAELQVAHNKGLLSDEEFEKARTAIKAQYAKEREDIEMEEMKRILDAFQTALDYMQQVSSLVFEALNNGVQKQLDDLETYYTTDAEEAAKNTNKKYITEKEYEKKKAALEMKQAKYAKAQALTDIGIQTALSIITTLAQLGATPWGIAASVIAGTMGAAQLAIAAAKPLAQYEKGRNGGPGEYALVGEKGPELMYIPEGASIVPNNKLSTPGAWAAYGVPEIPNTDAINYAALAGLALDYDKLGKAISESMKHESVVVNVNSGGVAVTRGRSTRTYLNTKYAGQWN